jgi:hypothetical protein
MQKRGHRTRWMMEVKNSRHFPTIDIPFDARWPGLTQHWPNKMNFLPKPMSIFPCFHNGRQAHVGVLGLR